MKKTTSHHRLLSEFCDLSGKILRSANRGVSLYQFLHEISRILIDFSQSDVVTVRIIDDGQNILCKTKRESIKDFRFEVFEDSIQFWEDSDLGEIRRAIMEHCLCDSSPFSTQHGSFLIGDTDKPVSFIHKGEGQRKEYRLNIQEGYHSIFLIPFAVEGRDVGILELGSRTANYFLEHEIQFYEGVAQTFGSAMLDRNARSALRERVKELTCLYGIAQVAQQTDATPDDVFQSIVRLLPPAFQFPDKAAASIVIDRQSYKSEGFQGLSCHQKVLKYSLNRDIYVNQELRGFVEVGYPEGSQKNEHILFLEEEHHLIGEVTRQISLIIEKSKVEEEKMKLQDQLRHADRLATIGELSAGVAHEINEPLGNILGFAQLSQKDQHLSGQTARDLEKIIKATLHAREVVKKLLIFARQLPVQKTEVNLNQIITEGLSFLESRCQKEGIELKVILSSDVPNTVLDASQLHQVMVNLVVNAIQAMPEGGIITVKTEFDEDEISLIVEDTGVGLSENVLKNIFIPFFTTKQVGQGTGLGLAVVHGIVTNHGGTIDVESEIGRGTRFEVKLPLRTTAEC